MAILWVLVGAVGGLVLLALVYKFGFDRGDKFGYREGWSDCAEEVRDIEEGID